MPFPLQRAPAALLAAFDLKTLGANPNGFSETVVPVVDVYDQYRPLSAATNTATITGPATAALVPLIVPDGFAWRVLAVSLEATLAVGDVALESQFQLTIGLGGSSFAYVIHEMVGGFSAIAGDRVATVKFERPLFLIAGQRFNGGVLLSAAPGTPVVCDVRAIVQAIPL